MTFSLFLLMDSIGNIPLFIALLKEYPRTRRLQIIFREMLIALLIMVAFHYLGDTFLSALSIKPYAVLISGGIILFLIALKMIFPTKHDDSSLPKDKEPFIVPLAIPLVAGPAVLAAIMLYARQNISSLTTIAAIILAWGLTTLILLSSTFLNNLLGKRGIIACERLMGLLLTMMSVQMFLQGISEFLHAHAHP